MALTKTDIGVMVLSVLTVIFHIFYLTVTSMTISAYAENPHYNPGGLRTTNLNYTYFALSAQIFTIILFVGLVVAFATGKIGGSNCF
jgi:hypothetical protein